MSTLTVSNVSDGSLTIPTTYVTNGSAKAWVNFNGGGTIATRDSLNVSSLTDNGTGDYTVNLTNAMGNADYSSVITGSAGGFSSILATQNLSATSSVRLYQRQLNSTPIDLAYMQFVSFGDLA